MEGTMVLSQTPIITTITITTLLLKFMIVGEAWSLRVQTPNFNEMEAIRRVVFTFTF
ncbi:MAG: hypothetical protein ACJATA_000300 [Sphingobacteriales bacterium]|jgi:hypothetical protein